MIPERNHMQLLENSKFFEQEIFDENNIAEELEEAPSDKKTRSPRKIVYVAGIVLNGQLHMQRYLSQVGMSNAGKNVFGNNFDRKLAHEEIKNLFIKEHGSEPEVIDGPFYPVRDPGKIKKKDEVSLKVASKYGLSGELATAIYKDWEVLVMFSNHKEYAQIFFKKYLPVIQEGQVAPKAPLVGQWVFRNDLSDIKPYED